MRAARWSVPADRCNLGSPNRFANLIFSNRQFRVFELCRLLENFAGRRWMLLLRIDIVEAVFDIV